MKDKMVKWLSPFIHSDPVEYEEYLEKLALQGWHPAKVSAWNAMRMIFVKSEPKQYRYVVDLQPILRQEYRQLHKDLGWELVGIMSSVVVWRKEYKNDRPESFSDKESLVRRNKKFSIIIGAMVFVFLACAVIASIGIPLIYGLIPSENRETADIAAAIASIVTIDVFALLIGLAWRRTKKGK